MLNALLLYTINAKLELIMATQQETAAKIDALIAQASKIGGETQTLLTRIEDLTAALAAAGQTSPEVDAAIAALEAQMGIVDDLVKDSDAPL